MAGPPENFKGAAFSHDEIFLQWDPPRETNGLISNYRVYFAEGENGEDQFYDTKSNEFMLTQLRSYCEYTISVVAFNQNGMGNPSQEILVKTFSNTPSEEPSNITVEATSSTVSEKKLMKIYISDFNLDMCIFMLIQQPSLVYSFYCNNVYSKPLYNLYFLYFLSSHLTKIVDKYTLGTSTS